jgi:hypothetical protein
MMDRKEKFHRSSSFKPWLRQVAVGVLFTFSFQQVSWAEPDLLKRRRFAQEPSVTQPFPLIPGTEPALFKQRADSQQNWIAQKNLNFNTSNKPLQPSAPPLQPSAPVEWTPPVQNVQMRQFVASAPEISATNDQLGTVAKQDFENLGLDIEGLWQNLIQKDENGESYI